LFLYWFLWGVVIVRPLRILNLTVICAILPIRYSQIIQLQVLAVFDIQRMGRGLWFGRFISMCPGGRLDTKRYGRFNGKLANSCVLEIELT